MTKKLFTAEETTILGIFPYTDYKEATMEETLGYMKAKSNLSASTDPIEWDASTSQFRIQGDMLESESATYEKGRCVRKQTSPPCGSFSFFHKNPPTKKGEDGVERIHFGEDHPCNTILSEKKIENEEKKRKFIEEDVFCSPYMDYDFESGKGTGKPVSEVNSRFYNKEHGGVCNGMTYTAFNCWLLSTMNDDQLTPECKLVFEQAENLSGLGNKFWKEMTSKFPNLSEETKTHHSDP